MSMKSVVFLVVAFLACASRALAAEVDHKAAASSVLLSGIEIYKDLAKSSNNICFSPLSIAEAFAMLREGAAGETARELDDLFHFSEENGASYRALNDIISNAPEDQYTIRCANSLWPRRDLKLLSSFVDAAKDHFSAEVRTLDFAGDPKRSRQTINDWIADATDKKIEDLIPEDAISSSTSMVLANALLFKAPWLNDLDPNDSAMELFAAPSGKRPLMMMKRLGMASYAELDDAVAVKLFYAYGDYSLTLILPKDGRDLSSLEASLDDDMLRKLAGRLTIRPVDLWLPRFKIDADLSLSEILSSLGARSAFSAASADLSGITGERSLFVSDAMHRAVIEVDEKGTEAAAATAIGVMLTSVVDVPQTEPVIFHADRPFFFVLREESSGVPLFMGRLVEP